MATRSKGDVEVVVDEEGGMSLDVQGVKGKSCEELTRALEKELGSVTNRRHKAEYVQKPRQHLEQGHGS